MSLAPEGYTVAITRLPLSTAAGVHRVDAPNVVGTPVLNIVDGRLRSVTVYPLSGRAVNIKAHRVTGLIVASRADHNTFAAWTR